MYKIIFIKILFLDDVVLGLTTTGTVKVWTLEPRDYGPTDVSVYENESKQIRCLNALTMACCSQHQRTVLIVCSKCWQVNIILNNYCNNLYFKIIQIILNLIVFSYRYMTLAIFQLYVQSMHLEENVGWEENF